MGTDLQPLLDLTGRAKGADVVALGFQVRNQISAEADRPLHAWVSKGCSRRSAIG